MKYILEHYSLLGSNSFFVSLSSELDLLLSVYTTIESQTNEIHVQYKHALQVDQHPNATLF